MPQYEYKCSKCGETFTEIRKVEERGAPIVCPHCQTEDQHDLVLYGGVKHSSWSKWNPIV